MSDYRTIMHNVLIGLCPSLSQCIVSGEEKVDDAEMAAAGVAALA